MSNTAKIISDSFAFSAIAVATILANWGVYKFGVWIYELGWPVNSPIEHIFGFFIGWCAIMLISLILLILVMIFIVLAAGPR